MSSRQNNTACRFGALVIVLAAASAVVCGNASAYWSKPGLATGAAQSDSLTTPSAVAATAGSTAANVTWTAAHA
ncbi:MAG: hypothetical protein ABIO67_01525, partial [Mycobacteriales bacterium]